MAEGAGSAADVSINEDPTSTRHAAISKGILEVKASSTSQKRQASFDLLYRENAARTRKLELKRKEKEQRERTVCTFSPKVDANSSKIVSSKCNYSSERVV